METSTKFAFLLIHFLTLFVQISNSAKTVLVDGVSVWKDPNVVAGDTIIFKNRYNYSLYIFRNERAFQLSNFTESAMLTNPNSTSFTWHPSRPGFFYFSFNNGSAQPCLEGHKLAIKVTLAPPSPSPEPSPVTSPVTFPATSPAPTPGGIVSSTPSFPWPFRPHEAVSPVSAPLPPLSSSPAPEDGDGGMPFISSNPAVTLPKGAVDSASIRPVSTSSRHAGATPQAVGMSAIYKVLCCVFFMMLL